MPATLVLEEFRDSMPGRPVDGLSLNPGPSQEIEAARAEGYEQGYAAGWDDASRAAQEEQSRISAEFAHNLLDLNFTFHEARSHVLCSITPVLKQALEKLLPELTAQYLEDIVAEQLTPVFETAADRPITIAAAPDNIARLQPILASTGTLAIEFVEEASLGPGQIRIRSGPQESLIDLDSAISRILGAIDVINLANQEAEAHGE